MRKIRTILAISAVILTQQAIADASDMMSSSAATTDTSCKTIVNACLSAGYKRTDVTGKRFWFDCMKPVLMGQTVKKITVSTDIVQKCRSQKIDELNKELQDLQNVPST
jgi:hypothetical protein